MLRLPEKMFLLNLRQDHFSKETRIFVDPTPPLLYLKNTDSFTQIQKNNTVGHLSWLVSETCMYRLLEIMFPRSLKTEDLRN